MNLNPVTHISDRQSAVSNSGGNIKPGYEPCDQVPASSICTWLLHRRQDLCEKQPKKGKSKGYQDNYNLPAPCDKVKSWNPKQPYDVEVR